MTGVKAYANARSVLARTVDMEVTRHNFDKTLPILQRALEECEYLAIDCEMTGLFADDANKNGNSMNAPPFLHDIEDRYEDMISSSQSFVITQFGVSAFMAQHRGERKEYVARTFNIYVFPRPYEDWGPNFLCSSASLDFLGNCGFDFNKWVCDGVGYLPINLRDARLAAVDAIPNRREISLTKDADVEFVRDMVEEIRTWLKSPESGDTLLLPAVNSFRRALQYQTLRRTDLGATRTVGYYVEKCADPDDGRVALRLTKATKDEIAEFEASQRQEKLNKIHEAAAFVKVMELIRNVKKPVIGHNLAFDLAYTLHSFVQPLPPTWPEYKKLVTTWFPGGIYDTKYLASLMPDLAEETSLGVLFKGLEKKSRHDDGYERYFEDNSYSNRFCHEAGYDAYMTGCVFAGLLDRFDKDGQDVTSYRWRINISRSDLEYAALEGEDPIPQQRSNVLLVTGPATTKLLSEQHKQMLVASLTREITASGMFIERGPSVRVFPIDFLFIDDNHDEEERTGALIVFSIGSLDEALRRDVELSENSSPAKAVISAVKRVLPSQCEIHPFSEFRRLKNDLKGLKTNQPANQLKRRRLLQSGRESNGNQTNEPKKSCEMM